jgi:hypothetical protein
MSAICVYEQVYCMLEAHLETTVPRSSRSRLALVVTGLLQAQHASPARVAHALSTLGLSAATAESIERRMRRFENDPHLDATLCVHPFARHPLALGKPPQLLLVLDPTSQDERLVMLTAAVWYRGRALPVAWALGPANQPLADERFWQRGATLLETAAALLPAHVPVTWLADRAFGTPAWIDLLTARGWHYVVRVQGQTRYQDVTGRCTRLEALVPTRGRRVKGAGQVFKKRGWRAASVVVYWGPRHDTPLALVSDLPPQWAVLALYRKRSPIEATFRDYKAHGWHWEQGQVTVLAHGEHLLVAMALATWLTIYAGVAPATAALAQPPTGRRRTRPWLAKHSLFTLGLPWWQQHFAQHRPVPLPTVLADWQAPTWAVQITGHHAKAYVFAKRD